MKIAKTRRDKGKAMEFYDFILKEMKSKSFQWKEGIEKWDFIFQDHGMKIEVSLPKKGTFHFYSNFGYTVKRFAGMYYTDHGDPWEGLGCIFTKFDEEKSNERN